MSVDDREEKSRGKLITLVLTVVFILAAGTAVAFSRGTNADALWARYLPRRPTQTRARRSRPAPRLRLRCSC